MDNEKGSPSVSGYTLWLLGPFFRWWWAGLTGVVSIFGFVWTPDSGLSLSPAAVLILIFFYFLILFFGLSSLTQGWQLYFQQQKPLRVLTVQKNLEGDSDLLFVIDGFLREKGGTLLEIRRVYENAELPFCIVRVIGGTDDGYIQATPIWTSAGHLRSFTRHEFEVRDLRVTQTLLYERVREAFHGTG